MRLIDADRLHMQFEKRMEFEKHRNHAYLKGVRDCIKDVKQISTIKTGADWILCSERLPTLFDDYLVKVGVNYGGEGRNEYIRTAIYNPAWKQWTVHETDTAIVGEPTEWATLDILERGDEE